MKPPSALLIKIKILTFNVILLSCVAHKPNYFITPYVFPPPILNLFLGCSMSTLGKEIEYFDSRLKDHCTV